MKVKKEAGLIYFFNEKNKFDMIKWLFVHKNLYFLP